MKWTTGVLSIMGLLVLLLGTDGRATAQPAKEFKLKRRAGGKEAAQLFNEIIAPLVGFTVAP